MRLKHLQLVSWTFAAALCLAPSISQAAPPAPKGATAVCNDGTYSSAKTERGACSSHGGVKKWLAEPKTAAGAAKPAPATKTDSPRTKTESPRTESPRTESPKTVPSSTPAASNPTGATAICNDGTYSHAVHHQGACSSHGGVKTWLK